MKPASILALQAIIDFCHDKWQEANDAPDSAWPTADIQTGRKMAYNDVLQHARKLLSEVS